MYIRIYEFISLARVRALSRRKNITVSSFAVLFCYSFSLSFSLCCKHKFISRNLYLPSALLVKTSSVTSSISVAWWSKCTPLNALRKLCFDDAYNIFSFALHESGTQLIKNNLLNSLPSSVVTSQSRTAYRDSVSGSNERNFSNLNSACLLLFLLFVSKKETFRRDKKGQIAASVDTRRDASRNQSHFRAFEGSRRRHEKLSLSLVLFDRSGVPTQRGGPVTQKNDVDDDDVASRVPSFLPSRTLPSFPLCRRF